MANLDPQVQIRLIDHALDFAKKTPEKGEEWVPAVIKKFDQHYKALSKTVSEANQTN